MNDETKTFALNILNFVQEYGDRVLLDVENPNNGNEKKFSLEES